MLVVQASVFADDGDALYRLHEPCIALGSVPGVVSVDCDLFNRDFFHLALDADVLVFPYLQFWDLFPLIEERRRRGKASVFETNDFYDDLHPWNPISPAWLDPDISITHRHLIAHADAIQTSTPYLSNHWRGLARRTTFFPNQLRTVPPLPLAPERPLTIGWGGSAGHLGDWYAITPTLQTWFDRNPDTRCAVMTYRHAEGYLRLPRERYSFRDFGSLGGYQDFLRSVDIGVVPLLPSLYNSGRSDVKFLEYAANGVVGVYARRGPYPDSVVHGETGLLYDSSDELSEHLDTLKRDRALRDKIRARAYDYVRDQRLLENNIEQRVEFYRSLVPTASTRNGHPLLSPYTPIAENAYQLKRRPLEERMLACIGAKPTDATANELRAIASENPGWFLPLQHLARTLNELKRPNDALAVVADARRLIPWSPALDSEEGRAYFLLNDRSRTLSIFEESVRRTPQYLPGWSLLLRVMKIARAAPEVLKTTRSQAEVAFPGSYLVRVLCLALVEDPTDAAAELSRLLDEITGDLGEYHRLRAAKTVVPFVLELSAKLSGPDLVVELLERAERAFPASFLLKERRAFVLRERGEHGISNSILAELAERRRLALAFQEELLPTSDGYLTWMVGEHLTNAAET